MPTSDQISSFSLLGRIKKNEIELKLGPTIQFRTGKVGLGCSLETNYLKRSKKNFFVEQEMALEIGQKAYYARALLGIGFGKVSLLSGFETINRGAMVEVRHHGKVDLGISYVPKSETFAISFAASF